MEDFEGMQPKRKVLNLSEGDFIAEEPSFDGVGLDDTEQVAPSRLKIKTANVNSLKMDPELSPEEAQHSATTIELRRPRAQTEVLSSSSTPPRLDRKKAVLSHQLDDQNVFMNSPESMSVTSDGRSRQEILSSIDETQLLSTQIMNRAKGLIKIAVPKFLETIFIQSFLYDFMVRYRDISVELIRYSGYAEDLNKDADITVFVGAHEGDEQQRNYIGNVAMGLYASPDLFEDKKAPNHPNQLASLKTLSMHTKSTAKWTFQDGARNVHIKPASALIFKDYDMILDMVVDSLGIAMLPKVFCQPYEEEGLVMELVEEYQPLDVELLAYTKASEDLPLHVRTFVDYLNKKYIREED